MTTARSCAACFLVCWPLMAGAQTLTPQALAPDTLAAIGAAADIAGTYIGLRVTGTHDGTAGYANLSPGHVAIGLLVQYASQRAISALLKRTIPKSRHLVDAVNANMGAHQLGYGADWGEILAGNHMPLSGYQRVELAFARAAQHQPLTSPSR